MCLPLLHPAHQCTTDGVWEIKTDQEVQETSTGGGRRRNCEHRLQVSAWVCISKRNCFSLFHWSWPSKKNCLAFFEDNLVNWGHYPCVVLGMKFVCKAWRCSLFPVQCTCRGNRNCDRNKSWWRAIVTAITSTSSTWKSANYTLYRPHYCIAIIFMADFGNQLHCVSKNLLSNRFLSVTALASASPHVYKGEYPAIITHSVTWGWSMLTDCTRSDCTSLCFLGFKRCKEREAANWQPEWRARCINTPVSTRELVRRRSYPAEICEW